jgi:uncharacterized protein (DUF2267 family)
MTLPRSLTRDIEVFETWLKAVAQEAAIDDPDDAYAALRAVARTLRERLSAAEAAHLSAQLPLILRGLYYEGYRPTDLPAVHGMAGFAAHVERRLAGRLAGRDPAGLAAAVGRVIGARVSAGEVAHVCANLPEDLRPLLSGASVPAVPGLSARTPAIRSAG